MQEQYGDLALMYDELVGDVAFMCFRENLERLINRNGISFDVAADIACGTGLAARYLAGKCSRVYAVDLSERMLEVARTRDPLGNTVFVRQSFTELELPEQVDLLTCNFDSLNYLTREQDLAEALRRFGSSLKDGGYACFDMNTARELEAGQGDAVMVHRVSTGVSVWESSWDRDRRVSTLLMTNFLRRADGSYTVSEEVHRERAYDLPVIEDALDRAGFSHVEYYDANGLSHAGPDTRRLQFLARK
jgi:SAM-dependent methyltransferase